LQALHDSPGSPPPSRPPPPPCCQVITEERSLAVAEYAFEFAYLNNRRRVTAVHKANIMKKGDGMFIKVSDWGLMLLWGCVGGEVHRLSSPRLTAQRVFGWEANVVREGGGVAVGRPRPCVGGGVHRLKQASEERMQELKLQ